MHRKEDIIFVQDFSLESKSITKFNSSSSTNNIGPRYSKPGLQAEKERAHNKYKKNIAMTDRAFFSA